PRASPAGVKVDDWNRIRGGSPLPAAIDSSCARALRWNCAVVRSASRRAAPEGEARLEAERATAQFQRRARAQLESIAAGKGEPPRILFQSSTLTPAGLARGRIQAQLELDQAKQADR